MNSQEWRYAVYTLLIASALASASGRIMSVTARDHRTPFLSANDRSRWSTVVSLVDDGTFVIDRFQTDKSWQTIDKVYHADHTGTKHFYSSKPPLLTTMVAAEYWLFQRVTGLKLEQQPFIVGRALLWCTNLPLFALYLVLLTSLVEQWGKTDWGRVAVVTMACWGTFLTTFVVTLSNHLPGAICVLTTIYCLSQRERANASGWFAGLAGASSAFAVTCELPALSFFALVAIWCIWRDRRAFVMYFLPAAAVVGSAYLVTNYVAHGSWRVAYSHREWYDYPGSYWTGTRSGPDRGEPSRGWYLFHVLIGHHGFFSLTPVWCLAGWGTWLLWKQSQVPLQRAVAGGTLLLTMLCIAFYVSRPEIDRNYGGVTCGLRWLFWLTPLGLLTLLPAADTLSVQRRGRVLFVVLFCVSLFSAAYGWANPWINPWPYQYAIAQGWLKG